MCKLKVNGSSTLEQVKQCVGFELNAHEHVEMRLFSYKGFELTQDTDLDFLPNNCILFVVLNSIELE